LHCFARNNKAITLKHTIKFSSVVFYCFNININKLITYFFSKYINVLWISI